MKTPIPILSGTALVIDDQESILSITEEMLTAKGMKVLLAQGGRAGVDLFQAHHQTIDIVLLDMKMPDMNGDEVFAHFQAIDPTVPVMIATGFDEQDILTRFAENEIIYFIQKPYRFQVLIDKIASVLSK